MKRKSCELCNAIESVYCAADSAFLCSSCDVSVHGATFLVARHLRWTHCVTCRSLLLISGPGSDTLRRICRVCRSSVLHAQPCCSSHSDASSCLSTAEPKKKRRREDTPTRGSRVKTKQRRNAKETEVEVEVEAVWKMARARKRVAREEDWAESD